MNHFSREINLSFNINSPIKTKFPIETLNVTAIVKHNGASSIVITLLQVITDTGRLIHSGEGTDKTKWVRSNDFADMSLLENETFNNYYQIVLSIISFAMEKYGRVNPFSSARIIDEDSVKFEVVIIKRIGVANKVSKVFMLYREYIPNPQLTRYEKSMFEEHRRCRHFIKCKDPSQGHTINEISETVANKLITQCNNPVTMYASTRTEDVFHQAIAEEFIRTTNNANIWGNFPTKIIRTKNHKIFSISKSKVVYDKDQRWDLVGRTIILGMRLEITRPLDSKKIKRIGLTLTWKGKNITFEKDSDVRFMIPMVLGNGSIRTIGITRRDGLNIKTVKYANDNTGVFSVPTTTRDRTFSLWKK